MDNILEDRLKRIERRQDSLQKTLDLLYADRSILEDILTRLGSVENALYMNKEHQGKVQRDLKSNIEEVQHRTEDKVNEIKEAIEEKTVIVKTPKKNLVKYAISKLSKLKKGKINATKNN